MSKRPRPAASTQSNDEKAKRRPFPCRKPKCSLRFAAEHSGDQHEEDCVTERTCGRCHKLFATKAYVRKHKCTAPGDSGEERDDVCNYCNQVHGGAQLFFTMPRGVGSAEDKEWRKGWAARWYSKHTLACSAQDIAAAREKLETSTYRPRAHAEHFPAKSYCWHDTRECYVLQHGALPYADPARKQDTPPSADEKYVWSSKNTNWAKPLEGAAAAAGATPVVGRAVPPPAGRSPVERANDRAIETLKSLIGDANFKVHRADLRRALELAEQVEPLLQSQLHDRERIAELQRAFVSKERELQQIFIERERDLQEIERQAREIDALHMELEQKPKSFRLSFELLERDPQYARRFEAFTGIKTPRVFRALFNLIDRGQSFAMGLTRCPTPRASSAPTSGGGRTRTLKPIDGAFSLIPC